MRRLLACCLAVLTGGCSAPEVVPEEVPAQGLADKAEARPNLLLIDIDTLRADRLGATRDDRPVTPNLAALSEEGTRFETMISQSGWTLPSVTALLTGRYPTGALALLPVDQVRWIGEHTRTVAQTLQIHGYRTAAFWGRTVPSNVPELSRGFTTVVKSPEEADPSQSAEAFVGWLESKPPEPWFAMVHPFDLHLMGETPPEALHTFSSPDHPAPCIENLLYEELVATWSEQLGTQGARELLKAHYDGAVHHQDAQVGRMLAALSTAGLSDRTVVIFTSNHGEQWFEHGGFDHGPPYDFNLRVPLIVRDPGLADAPGSISTMTQTVDIAPTLLELAGVSPDVGMVGSSLVPLLRGEAGASEQTAYVITDNVRVALRTQEHKLMICGQPGCAWVKPQHVAYPTYELYDLKADPEERHNLVAGNPPELAPLKDKLAMFIEQFGPAGPSPTARLTWEQRKAIRARGYWGSSASDDPQD